MLVRLWFNSYELEYGGLALDTYLYQYSWYILFSTLLAHLHHYKTRRLKLLVVTTIIHSEKISSTAAVSSDTITLLQVLYSSSSRLDLGTVHPGMHGLLRMTLSVQDEMITNAHIDLGYLHRGTEKLIELLNHTHNIAYMDRLEYVAGYHMEHLLAS